VGGQVNITLVNRSSGPPLQASAQKTSEREWLIFLDDMTAQIINSGGKTAQAIDARGRGPTVR